MKKRIINEPTGGMQVLGIFLIFINIIIFIVDNKPIFNGDFTISGILYNIGQWFFAIIGIICIIDERKKIKIFEEQNK